MIRGLPYACVCVCMRVYAREARCVSIERMLRMRQYDASWGRESTRFLIIPSICGLIRCCARRIRRIRCTPGIG